MTFRDPRVTPARPDRAAASLRGEVEAPLYVDGLIRRIAAPSAPLTAVPDAAASLQTEALCGEQVTVYDESAGWSWVQFTRDGYVGYLPTDRLGAWSEPTHRVAVPRAHVYPGPSIKTRPLFALAMGARLTVERETGDFLVTAEGWHLFRRHLAVADHVEPDFVAVAERFVDTPYLWGGRTWEGVDCSGLIQTALTATGVAAPRDSDMQERGLGVPLAADSLLERGDLVFWKGHIGVIRDAETLLHANGWHMRVVSEPLREAVERIAANGGGRITSIRRL